MYITYTVHVPHPIEDCVAAVARSPQTWFPDFAGADKAAVGIDVAGIPFRKRVSVLMGSLTREGDWAEVEISWSAEGPKALFPVFHGKVQLAPVDSSVTRLSVSGMYEPPLGRLGSELDDAVMHRVAKATVKELAESIADRLAKAS
ncbi:MAG TPA: hypothetical protein VGX27_00410 [Candidatus Dormibacteraeota bacterium]|nr:hypothetical protein [Candidatus Dormibacteraeota bacterium]